ncbi:MAG: glycine/sarcosine/betaine reductase complex component C subunit beta [bacterium]
MEPVIKGTAYILVHTPNLLVRYGTTQVLERRKESPYLKDIYNHVRPYAMALGYAPFQTYIGNLHPDALAQLSRPWFTGDKVEPKRFGSYGEIMPEDEFYAWMCMTDVFDLVWLERDFVEEIKEKLQQHPLWGEKDTIKLGEGKEKEAIMKRLDAGSAEPLTLGDRIVGCVRRAHEFDENLSSHIIAENTAAKASGVVALRHLLSREGIAAEEIDYIIEASEEATGDMNQRGGGNFAKAIGEHCGCINATGADVRGFCAGPSHAVLQAAGLVKSGIFRNVVVLGGGAVAKLGMNGKEQVAKGMPILEDVLGGFAILISQNDGVNPIIRTDSIGKHKIGSGSSPQAVMQALVGEPLDRLGLKLTDVDKYAVEMQIPEFTEPAGAGDVPAANYRLIAALAVMRKEIERQELPSFVQRHGMVGFAPTQGHIPSGVPVIGHARDAMLAGELHRVMIIGKGSLFLARMTNLFDGLSFLMESNPGIVQEEIGVDRETVRKLIAESMRNLAESYIKEE